MDEPLPHDGQAARVAAKGAGVAGVTAPGFSIFFLLLRVSEKGNVGPPVQRLNDIHRLSVAALLSHPVHGFIPIA